MGIAFFVFIGLCLGSFVNALVWRIHEGKDWIRARSQCPNCAHRLGILDLVPVLSWLALRGRCRYCKKPISSQYPIVELFSAAWVGASFYFWPNVLATNGQKALLAGWLISSVGLIALMVYDHNWMILPSKIIYGSLVFATVGRVIYIILDSKDVKHDLISWGLSLVIASGLFFVIHEISKGQWIGFGDVRLGLLTGTLLADPSKSLLMIFLASLLGTLFAFPKLLDRRKVLSTRFAYGPFLIISSLICVLFGQNIINWYLNSF